MIIKKKKTRIGANWYLQVVLHTNETHILDPNINIEELTKILMLTLKLIYWCVCPDL